MELCKTASLVEDMCYLTWKLGSAFPEATQTYNTNVSPNIHVIIFYPMTWTFWCIFLKWFQIGENSTSTSEIKNDNDF